MSKKKIITAVCLVAALGLLVAGYFILSNWEPSEDNDNDFEFTPGYTLFNVQATEIERIFKLTDEFEFTLVFDGEAWSVLGDDTVRLDQTLAQRFATDASTVVSIERVAEDEIFLAQFGLAEPIGIVRLTLQDGTVHTLQVGGRTPLQTAFYVNTYENPEEVFTLHESRINALLAPLAAIRDRTISSITQDDIAYFNIYRITEAAPAVTERIAMVRRSEEEIMAEVEAGIAGVAASGWRMTSPMNVNSNDVAVNDILFRLGSLTIAEFVDGNEVSLGDAGLDSPNYVIEFGDGEGRDVRLHIGRRDGALSFARIYPNSQIFKINNSDISFKNIIVRELINRLIHLADIETVSMVRIVHVNEMFELIIDTEGNDSINGITIERTEASRLYREILGGILIEGPAARPAGARSDVRIEYHYNDGRTADIIELYSISERFSAVSFNGVVEFSTETRGVNMMLGHLRDAVSNN